MAGVNDDPFDVIGILQIMVENVRITVFRRAEYIYAEVITFSLLSRKRRFSVATGTRSPDAWINAP